MLKIVIVRACIFMIRFRIKTHSLSLLLNIELIVILLIVVTLTIGYEIFFGLLIVCVGACEGAVGLGALIGLTRNKGGVDLRCTY